MIVFVLPTHAFMGKELAASLGIQPGHCSLERFANQELHAALQTNVVHEECLILGSIAPPDEQLLSTLLLSHTLKKEWARNIIALLPYLAYCEQLQQRGVRDITILVTHGLFTGTLWHRLWSLGVNHIYCTDTVPLAHERTLENICTASVLPLLRQHLQARE
jgi:phosphoribosylpyrophosphate synthetase